MGKRKTYSPSFKFKVVIEAFEATCTDAEVARMHGIHPVTLAGWKRQFLDNGPQVFGSSSAIKELEEKIAKLERMLGQKEVEIALLKNFSQGS